MFYFKEEEVIHFVKSYWKSNEDQKRTTGFGNMQSTDCLTRRSFVKVVREKTDSTGFKKDWEDRSQG